MLRLCLGQPKRSDLTPWSTKEPSQAWSCCTTALQDSELHTCVTVHWNVRAQWVWRRVWHFLPMFLLSWALVIPLWVIKNNGRFLHKLHVARGDSSPPCYQIQLFLFNFLFSFPSLACVGHWSCYGVSRSVCPLKTSPIIFGGAAGRTARLKGRTADPWTTSSAP